MIKITRRINGHSQYQPGNLLWIDLEVTISNDVYLTSPAASLNLVWESLRVRFHHTDIFSLDWIMENYFIEWNPFDSTSASIEVGVSTSVMKTWNFGSQEELKIFRPPSFRELWLKLLTQNLHSVSKRIVPKFPLISE